MVLFFFFKQKTAYEMRISDWSSDVCSSDLANPDGSTVRVRDVARVELNAQSEDTSGRFTSAPAAIIGIFQAPGTNAVAAAEGVRSAPEELTSRFPEGVDYKITYDTTTFVTDTIDEVVHTLIEDRSEENTSELQSLMRISYDICCWKNNNY